MFRPFFLHFCRGTFFFLFSFFLGAREHACSSFCKNKNKKEKKLMGEERTRSRSHAASVHTTQVVRYKTNKPLDVPRAAAFGSAGFVSLRRSFAGAVCVFLCLSSYFFFFMTKKKRNLGATVRHEETAHSHTVSCLSRVENDLDKTVNAPVSHVVVMHGI